jgi:probable rRNA maturation factor
MIQVNLFVGSRYPVDRKLIRQKVKQVLQKNNVDNAQVDISIVGARKIEELNKKSLNHEGKTDVLSFPQHEKKELDDFPLPQGVPPHLGDIVVSFPEAVATAKRFGKLVDGQICFYVEHGLMHLLGFHHE